MTTSAGTTHASDAPIGAAASPGGAARRPPKDVFRSIGHWLTDRRAHLRWALLGAGAILAFVLAYIGYVQFYADEREMIPKEHAGNWTDYVYRSLMLFLPDSGPEQPGLPVTLDIARYLAPTVAGFAALTGLMVLFRDRTQQLRMVFMSDHVVVCGLGYVGNIFVDHLRYAQNEKVKQNLRQIWRDLAKGKWNWQTTKHAFSGTKVVVVEKDPANPLIELCRAQGVPVIVGDAQQQRTLRAAGVHRAARLLAVSNEDAANSQIIAEAQQLAKGRQEPLHCLARIANPHLCSVLRWRELNHTDDGSSSVDFFNLDERGASLWLQDFHFEDHPQPHLLVGRLDGLGVWLVIHAARIWYQKRIKDIRTQDIPLWITVVDDCAIDRIDDIKARHPELVDVCKFIPVTTRDSDLLAMSDTHRDCKAPPLTYAYVTADRDEDALEGALAVRQALDRIDPAIPLVVAMSRDHGVARLINDARRNEYATAQNVDVFPVLERVCTTEFVLGGSWESIAIALHECWRRMNPDIPNQPDLPNWAELDEPRKQSSRAQARDIKVKLRNIGCHVNPLSDWAATKFTFTEGKDNTHKNEIEELARAEHHRWWEERKAAGWQSCDPPGTEEQKRQKLSPWMIEFEALPEEIADYDRNFVRAIPEILASAGYQIERRGAPERDDGTAHADD